MKLHLLGMHREHADSQALKIEKYLYNKLQNNVINYSFHLSDSSA